jgi:BirA family transcriptional regulator, biotin operon repressor / biotin---[acetyl-CoA-carboxylase] ligase
LVQLNEASSTTDLFDAAALKRALGEHAQGFALNVREACESSNTALLHEAERGAAHRTVLLCHRQTGGRGRRGRSWLSSPEGSLTFSLLWRFPPGAPLPMGLSLAVGVAVARALETFGAKDVRLKWPNDLLLHGRKLAGILVDLHNGRGTPAGAVIGIGLNLRLPASFPAREIPATDLVHAMAEPPTRVDLLARLLIELAATLETFDRAGFAAARQPWLARHAMQDVPVQVVGDRDSVVGICRGIDNDGALLLETAFGLQRIVAGDVSLRPHAGD